VKEHGIATGKEKAAHVLTSVGSCISLSLSLRALEFSFRSQFEVSGFSFRSQLLALVMPPLLMLTVPEPLPCLNSGPTVYFAGRFQSRTCHARGLVFAKGSPRRQRTCAAAISQASLLSSQTEIHKLNAFRCFAHVVITFSGKCFRGPLTFVGRRRILAMSLRLSY
jgi:hypothetical protein